MADPTMRPGGLASAAPAAAPPQQAPAPEQGEPASAEDQALYDNIWGRAVLMLYDEESEAPRPSVVKMLSEGDPRQTLGETAANIFFRVEQAAAKAGVQIPDDVKEAAGMQVFGLVADLATDQGIHDFENDDEARDGALIVAADNLRLLESQAGMIDPEKTSADFDDLIEADRDGRLAAILGEGARG